MRSSTAKMRCSKNAVTRGIAIYLLVLLFIKGIRSSSLAPKKRSAFICIFCIALAAMPSN